VDAGDVPAAARFPGFDALDPADAAARIAAAREAFEEAAILLSDGPPVAAATRAALRPRSDRHELSFPDLLAEIDHRLAASCLRPFARWIPPEGLHQRYDTRFYLAALPPGETLSADGHEAVHAPDGREAVKAFWARPAALLAEADEGAMSLLFPTRCNVARLAAFPSVAALLADETPPPFVQPAVTPDGWIAIPENIGYPWTRERLDKARRA